jgi:hypothetical protein
VDESKDAQPQGHAEDVAPGAHAPLDDRRQPPDGFPIKGNLASKVYHVPGSPFYDRAVAQIWFSSAEAAEAAGFRLPRSHRRPNDHTDHPDHGDHSEHADHPDHADEFELSVEQPEQPGETNDASSAVPPPAAEPDVPAASEPQPQVEPEPAYVSSFQPAQRNPAAVLDELPGLKRLLPAVGAGAIAFLVIGTALRRRKR